MAWALVGAGTTQNKALAAISPGTVTVMAYSGTWSMDAKQPSLNKKKAEKAAKDKQQGKAQNKTGTPTETEKK